jgi:Cupin domain
MQTTQTLPQQVLLPATPLAPLPLPSCRLRLRPSRRAPMFRQCSPPASQRAGQESHRRCHALRAGCGITIASHACSVFAYVLSGVIRSQVYSGGLVKDYKAGESFFEPPGSDHLVSANAGTTEPASLLAIFAADNGAVLTALDK